MCMNQCNFIGHLYRVSIIKKKQDMSCTRWKSNGNKTIAYRKPEAGWKEMYFESISRWIFRSNERMTQEYNMWKLQI